MAYGSADWYNTYLKTSNDIRGMPRRRAWQPTLIFLPGESHGQRSLAGYISWGCKESAVTEQLSTHRHNTHYICIYPRWCRGKESACQCWRRKDVGLIPGLGGPPGAGNGSPFQYSCLESPMGRGVWWATIQESQSQTGLTEQLSIPANTQCMLYIMGGIVSPVWPPKKNICGSPDPW